MKDAQDLKPIERFTFCQKLFIRTCLYGAFATGVAGVFLEDIYIGFAYLAFLGVTGLVVMNCFCSHCPYPCDHSTCLGMPHFIVSKFFRHKAHPLKLYEKILFLLVLSVAILFPQYWLFRRKALFYLYWVFCLPTFIFFPLYFCRRCLNENCPFNPRRSD